MRFECETFEPEGPATFVDEHLKALALQRSPNPYVNMRWVDAADGAVLYVGSIISLPHGDEMGFVLYQGQDEIRFNVTVIGYFDPSYKAHYIRISRSLDARREHATALIWHGIQGYDSTRMREEEMFPRLRDAQIGMDTRPWHFIGEPPTR